jgi:hypothetical protein
MEELSVYSIPQKSKTIPDATCRISDPDSGNITSSLDLNSSIPVVDYMNLPIAQNKGFRSCTQHLMSNFVSY